MTQSGHLAAKLGDGNRTTIRATMRRVAWWSIKIVCGAAAIYGTFIVAFSSLDLFFLLTGRVLPDSRQPSVVFVSTMLAIGMVLMIGGYKAPTWFGIDRSARPHRAKRISITRVVVLLLIVFGIFAAISIPNYADYTVRAQVSEGLNLAGGAKAAVAEYYQDYKQFPSDNVTAGLAPATDIQGKYVSSVRIEAGEIVVTYGNDADSDIRGDTLVFRPEASDQSVTFVCFSLDIAPRNLPAACR